MRNILHGVWVTITPFLLKIFILFNCRISVKKGEYYFFFEKWCEFISQLIHFLCKMPSLQHSIPVRMAYFLHRTNYMYSGAILSLYIVIRFAMWEFHKFCDLGMIFFWSCSKCWFQKTNLRLWVLVWCEIIIAGCVDMAKI